MLALGALMPEKPSFLLAGVNHGPNMGEDVLYSGTVSAAMEGLTAGVPSVAVSFAGADLAILETYGGVLERLLAHLVAVPDFPKETLLSVNLPPLPASKVKGVRITTLGTRVFSEEIMQMSDPWGRPIYWIGGGRASWSGRDDSDFRAVHDGYVSVTPLHVDLTNYRLLEAVRAWQLSI
jgi:5'-nucleotidase